MTLTPVQRAAQESLHPTRSWYEDCLQFVRTMFGLPANGHEPTAYSAWLFDGGAKGAYTHTAIAAPANVPVYYKGSGPDGHIAVSVGHGMVLSSDIARKGKIDLTSDAHIEAAWGMKYLGWSELVEGKRVIAHV